MNSQWNVEGGPFVRLGSDPWTGNSTWAPLTPEKPIPMRSNVNSASVVQTAGRLQGTSNGPPLSMAGHTNGYLLNMSSYSGSALDFNLNEVATDNEHYLGNSINIPLGNQMAEQNAGTSTDIFEVDGVSWSNRPFTDILASANLGFSPLLTGASSEGLGVAQDFWSLDNQAMPNCRNLGSSSMPIADRGNNDGTAALWNNCIPAQVPQCEFPLLSRPIYDLNSTPPREGNAPPSVINSSQFVPETLDQVKTGNHQLSETIKYTPAENIAQEINRQGKIVPHVEEESPNRSEVLLEKVIESDGQMQGNHTENSDGIGLNTTPQLKTPKRKKHRPKVIVEGKPKRSKQTEAQEKANGKESTVTKRKYVRRKGPKESAIQQADAAGKTSGSQNPAAAKFCRRALNFDLEQTVESIAMAEQDKTSTSDRPNFSLPSHSQTSEQSAVVGFMHGATTDPQICRDEVSTIQTQPVSEQSDAACAEKRPEQALPILDRAAAGLPAAGIKDKLQGREPHDAIGFNRLSDLINGHVTAQNANHEPRHVCLEGEEYVTGIGRSRQAPGQLAASNFPIGVEARGLKRGYNHNNEQEFSSSHSLMNFPSVWQLLQISRYHQNNSSVGSECSTAMKKKKTENGGDDTPSHFVMVNNSSRQDRLFNPVVTWIPTPTGDMQNVSALDSIYRRVRDKIDRCPPESYFSSNFACNNSESHASAQLRSYFQWKEVARRSLDVNRSSLTAVQTCKIQVRPDNSSSSRIKEMVKGQQKSFSVDTPGPIKIKPTPPRGRQKNEKKEMHHSHQLSGAKQKGSTLQMEDWNPLDQIIHKLCLLNLNGEGSLSSGSENNALVLYKGDGTIIPYEGPALRKRKPRPKVDLDAETYRIWNLLMGKESEGHQDDTKKEKWWQEEREVFRGRADSFIARMHLIQGDRRFSRWKGSVVDSVIGVFLTQNVSDHLSSSAFMSLVARFPPGSTRISTATDRFNADLLLKEPLPLMLNPGGTLVLHDNMQQMNRKILLKSWNGRESAGTEKGQTRSPEEEIISLQESFDCSIAEGYGGVRSSSGSNSESEDMANHLKPEETCGFILEASPPKEKFKSLSQELPSNSKVTLEHRHEQSNISKYDHQSLRLDRPESTCRYSGYASLFKSNNQLAQLPPIRSTESQTQSKESRAPRVHDDILGEESMFSWLTMSQSGDAVRQSKAPVNHSVLPGSKGNQLTTSHRTNFSTTTCSPSSILVPTTTISQSFSIQHFHEHEKSISQEASCSRNSGGPWESITLEQDSMHLVLSPSLQTVNRDHKIPGVDMYSHLQDSLVKTNAAENMSSLEVSKETQMPSKAKRGKSQAESKKIDWDILRREVQVNCEKKERNKDTIDSIDYEAIRQASISEISDTIRERGMNNMLAERIKGFLDRLVQEHGSIDLEWLRDVSPDKAKDYLLSIRGLGLKSVECVRLLTLHNLAFPVDTNVGRIAVRLGWVPLQPLPESLQLHLLELYPVLESVQKYLWPRLCKLDQPTLYELHYQLITFGKVFCTKSRPNCNACPMRGECRHFASAFTSARLALPASEDKSLVPSQVIPVENTSSTVVAQVALPSAQHLRDNAVSLINNCKPIIEEPATPEEERAVALDRDIEDFLDEDDDEIPTIKLNIKEFTDNLQNFMQQSNMELQEADMSKALVALNPEAASIPARKLKNVSRLRTEHQVYELPDDHPLLDGLERREEDDPSPYLLAIWTPGETPNSVQHPQEQCKLQNTGSLCNEPTCFSCNSIREAHSQTVRGTLLIPCRTAMRGSFPLNGTYFQVNEMFADHKSSLKPLFVPRDTIWNLRRRTVYFGTSVTAIFRGLSTEEVQYCFWRGFVCVRGFERETRAPRPLVARLHFPASKAKAKTNIEKDD